MAQGMAVIEGHSTITKSFFLRAAAAQIMSLCTFFIAPVALTEVQVAEYVFHWFQRMLDVQPPPLVLQARKVTDTVRQTQKQHSRCFRPADQRQALFCVPESSSLRKAQVNQSRCFQPVDHKQTLSAATQGAWKSCRLLTQPLHRPLV